MSVWPLLEVACSLAVRPGQPQSGPSRAWRSRACPVLLASLSSLESGSSGPGPGRGGLSHVTPGLSTSSSSSTLLWLPLALSP